MNECVVQESEVLIASAAIAFVNVAGSHISLSIGVVVVDDFIGVLVASECCASEAGEGTDKVQLLHAKNKLGKVYSLTPSTIPKATVHWLESSLAFSNPSSSIFKYGLFIAWKVVTPRKNQMLRTARKEQKMPQHFPNFCLSVKAILLIICFS